MNHTLSDILLYLVCVYATSGVLVLLTRRLKLNDFIAFTTGGMLVGMVLWGIGDLRGTGNSPPFSREYRMTDKTVTIIQPHLADSSSLQLLQSYRKRSIPGEEAYLDSLRFYLDVPMDETLSWQILRASRQVPANAATQLVSFLAYIGILLFMMQLGTNIDPGFLRFNLDSKLLWQSTMMVFINVAVLFGLGFFLLFDGRLTPTLLITISLMSINAGGVIARRFPIQPEWKRPVSRLLQITAITDILAIAGCAWMVLLNNYQDQFPGKLAGEIGSWIVLILFAFGFMLSGHVKRLLESVHKWPFELNNYFRGSFILLFIYCGFNIKFPVMVLGLGAGLLFNQLVQRRDHPVRQRFFAFAAWLYPLPFIEIGRSALNSMLQLNPEIWANTGILLIGFTAIAAVVAVFWMSQKQYPVMMSLSFFPRGEISLFILWIFRDMELITPPVFVSAVFAVLISSILVRPAAIYLWKNTARRVLNG